MNLASPLPPLRGLLPLALAFGLMTPAANSALVTMAATDQGGESSFNTGIYWSDATAPHAGNGYFATGSFIRTPTAAGDYTFGGDYLQLFSSSLVYTGVSGRTITMNDLRLQRGSLVGAATGPGTTFTLAGNVTLDPASVAPDGSNAAGFQLRNGNSGYTVSATISGGGILKIFTNSATQFTTAVILTHANNTYTGGTRIESNAFLIAQANSAFGTGNVTIAGGKIKFELAATNDYIADSASLILATGLATRAVELNFTGSDVIGGLSLNGGGSFLGVGTYTASDLNTLYGSAVFTGLGNLSVIPEPSVTGLCLLGFAGVRLGYRRMRQNTAHMTL